MTEENFQKYSSRKIKSMKSYQFGDIYGTDSDDSSDNELRNDFEDEIKTLIKNEIDTL